MNEPYFLITGERMAKVVVYNIKGGQGKTTLAVNIAKELGYRFITNENSTRTLTIYEPLLKAGGYAEITSQADINPSKNNCVYDLGGWADTVALNMAENADLCIVPLCFQSVADFTPALQTMQALAERNDHIILVLNNTDKELVVQAVEHFKEKHAGLGVFIINKSKYINYLADENKTVFDLAKDSGLIKYQTKVLRGQFEAIFNYISDC